MSLTLPLSALNATPSPKFGWNKDTVHVERIKLSKGDITEDGTPTDVLVENVASFLRRNTTDDPGFVVIENTRKQLKKEAPLHFFLEALVLNVFEPLGFKRPNLVFPRHINGLQSYKNPHWDGSGENGLDVDGAFSVLGFAHGPYKRIQGGIPFVADALAYAEDSGMPLEQLSYGAIIAEDERKELLNTHAVFFHQLDYHHDRPIILVNNQYPKGLVHGASSVKKLKNGTKKSKRSIFHVSAAVTPQSKI